jgi:chaperonin cofactor prefoldin
MNGTKDPVKRKEKLQERIKHLEEQRAVVDDQIDIMKGEIRAIDVNEYIISLENRALDVMK